MVLPVEKNRHAQPVFGCAPVLTTFKRFVCVMKIIARDKIYTTGLHVHAAINLNNLTGNIG